LIIWINGAFGAGKTTLAEELKRRMPEAVLFDPEYVGYILREWVPVPTGDFQDLPSWRELVIETALALRKHHAETLIIPMTLINDAYARQILDGIAERGEDVIHVFLDLDTEVLRQRINDRILHPAATVLLRSDKLSPAELADEIMSQLTGESRNHG
jgi:predicted kinase